MDIPEFGIKREHEERRDGACVVAFDPSTQRYAVGKQHENGRLRLFSGGVDGTEHMQEGALRELIEESGLYNFGHVEKIGAAMAHYHNSLRNVNRVALSTCFLVILKSTDVKPTELEEHEKFSLAWVTLEDLLSDIRSRNQNQDNDHWIYFVDKAVARIAELGYSH